MSGTLLTKAFLVIGLVGCLLTASRLLWSGLSRRYPVFTLYIILVGLDSVWPVLIPQKSILYARLWTFTEPSLHVFSIFCVLELYRLMLERYKGLYSLGRWVMYGASALSVVISILMLLPRITPAMRQATIYIGYAAAFNRGVDFSLTIFILLILIFLSQYPITLSRNLVAHASVFSIYFLSRGTYVLVRTAIWRYSTPTLDLVFSGIVAACTIAWFFLLTPKGEETKANRIRFSPEYEARVLQKLDALNQVLLKSSRR